MQWYRGGTGAEASACRIAAVSSPLQDSRSQRQAQHTKEDGQRCFMCGVGKYMRNVHTFLVPPAASLSLMTVGAAPAAGAVAGAPGKLLCAAGAAGGGSGAPKKPPRFVGCRSPFSACMEGRNKLRLATGQHPMTTMRIAPHLGQRKAARLQGEGCLQGGRWQRPEVGLGRQRRLLRQGREVEAGWGCIVSFLVAAVLVDAALSTVSRS